MSNREKCISIVNSFTESQLENIAVLLEAAKKAVDEAEDETYCNFLYKEYLNDPDKEGNTSIEDLSKQLGITL